MQYLDRRNRRRSVDIRQGVVRDRDERQQPATLDPSRRPRPIRRFYVKDRIMLITVCRLYDSYPDAHRVIVALEAAGLPPSETSVISNNSYTWYSAAKNANVVPLQKDSGGSKAGKPMARSRGRPSGLRSARQRQPLPASSPCWRFLVSPPSSAPDGFLLCWVAWQSAASPAVCWVR